MALLTTLFYFGDSTGALYEQWYAPRLRIHYSRCYQNAFWNGRDMTFGDGCSALYPLVSQDVVAHELGHGITDRYSDLYYSGQSGGINEAFSDMSEENT
ncbi:elastase-like isoform X2 [Littorina saxatilis]|uniref:elastase-like isoform X2 n=1 Tax=Littorina saxatilis TaxID=31220 RepID=UPI0038B68499